MKASGARSNRRQTAGFERSRGVGFGQNDRNFVPEMFTIQFVTAAALAAHISSLQMGHFLLIMSQRSIHSMWKTCEQWSVRTSSPVSKSHKQTVQRSRSRSGNSAST